MGSFAIGVVQLLAVNRHQRTSRVKKEIQRLGVVGQGVELTAKWLVVSQCAALRTQVLTGGGDTQAPQVLFFSVVQRDFQGRKTFIDTTTQLTLSAMIKKHTTFQRALKVDWRDE
jgi:hypothetical protein